MKKSVKKPFILLALIKLSAIAVTAISGKAGGTVFSRNRGGAYAKNFVMPVNTFTDLRQQVRAIFGAISSAWRGLNDEQRNSWFEQAPNYPVTNPLGDEITLSPNALHQSLNTNLMTAGQSMITTALPPGSINAVVSTSDQLLINATLGELSFTLNLLGTNLDYGTVYVVEATPGYSSSIKNVENQYRVLLNTSSPNASAPTGNQLDEENFGTDSGTVYDAYVARFGVPTDGNRVSLRIWGVSPVTGQVTSKWVMSTIVVS